MLVVLTFLVFPLACSSPRSPSGFTPPDSSDDQADCEGITVFVPLNGKCEACCQFSDRKECEVEYGISCPPQCIDPVDLDVTCPLP